MKTLACSAAVIAALSTPLHAQTQKVTPPIAVYWMSVETNSGMGGMPTGVFMPSAAQGGKRVKLDLGSTAKLRALASYLEAIATLHEKLAGRAPEALAETAANGPDPLTRFVAETLEAKPDTGLEAMLEVLRRILRRHYADLWPQ